MQQTVSITVSGKVQGVYYRQSTKEKALSLDLKGQVKNMPDGSVYIIATGEKNNIKQLIDWCHQGPPRAIVSHVSVKELSFRLFEKFDIVR